MAQKVKVSACNAGDLGSIPGSGRAPGEGNGNPLQYPCLENSMDGGAWSATVHGVTKSPTRLNNFNFTLEGKTELENSKLSVSSPSFFHLVCVLSHSVLSNFATPWTVAFQAPLSMGFFRQECWSGLPFPPPGDLPDTRVEPTSPVWAGGFPPRHPHSPPATWETPVYSSLLLNR